MGYLHTALVIAASTTTLGILRAWWSGFKQRKAQKPTPTKLRKGVYVPWGIVERVESMLDVALVVWLIYIAALILLLIYKYSVGW